MTFSSNQKLIFEKVSFLKSKEIMIYISGIERNFRQIEDLLFEKYILVSGIGIFNFTKDNSSDTWNKNEIFQFNENFFGFLKQKNMGKFPKNRG